MSGIFLRFKMLTLLVLCVPAGYVAYREGHRLWESFEAEAPATVTLDAADLDRTQEIGRSATRQALRKDALRMLLQAEQKLSEFPATDVDEMESAILAGARDRWDVRAFFDCYRERVKESQGKTAAAAVRCKPPEWLAEHFPHIEGPIVLQREIIAAADKNDLAAYKRLLKKYQESPFHDQGFHGEREADLDRRVFISKHPELAKLPEWFKERLDRDNSDDPAKELGIARLDELAASPANKWLTKWLSEEKSKRQKYLTVFIQCHKAKQSLAGIPKYGDVPTELQFLKEAQAHLENLRELHDKERAICKDEAKAIAHAFLGKYLPPELELDKNVVCYRLNGDPPKEYERSAVRPNSPGRSYRLVRKWKPSPRKEGIEPDETNEFECKKIDKLTIRLSTSKTGSETVSKIEATELSKAAVLYNEVRAGAGWTWSEDSLERLAKNCRKLEKGPEETRVNFQEKFATYWLRIDGLRKASATIASFD